MEEQTGTERPKWESDWHPITDKEKVSFVNRLYEDNYNLMWNIHRNWYSDMLWYYGEHYMEFSTLLKRFHPKPMSKYVPRSTTNLILDKVESGVARIIDEMPIGQIVANSEDPEDWAAAKVANKIRNELHRVQKFKPKLRTFATWLTVTGTAILTEFLDKSKKSKILIEEPNKETGEMEKVEYFLVDVSREVMSPFEFIPDWGHPEDMHHYMHHKAQDMEWFYENFGSKHGVVPEKTLSFNTFYQYKINDLIARTSYSSGFTQGNVKERILDRSAIVKTFNELPSSRYEKGRCMMVANDQLLYDGGYPYGNDLNVHVFRWHIIPGTIFGFGMVRNLINPNKRLNGIDTQIDLIRKKFGNPAWLSPKGAAHFIQGTSEPGRKYEYSAKRTMGNKPELLEPKGSHGDAKWQREIIKLDMEEISGMMKILKGIAPQGVKAGVSLDILADWAESRFGPFKEEFLDTLMESERMNLKLAQAAPAWNLERAKKICGSASAADAVKFFEADFGGNIDVKLEPVPSRYHRKTAKTQKFIEAVESGLLNVEDIHIRRKGLQLLGLEDFDETSDIHFEKAEYENKILKEGKLINYPLLNPFDNHEIHFEVHLRPTLARDFHVTWGNKQKANLLAHIVEHLQAMQPTTASPEVQEMRTSKRIGTSAVNEGMSPESERRSKPALMAKRREGQPLT